MDGLKSDFYEKLTQSDFNFKNKDFFDFFCFLPFISSNKQLRNNFI